jgi:multidrug resistance efflux pump
MDVIAPKDAFITAVLIADVSHVEVGTPILTLDSVDEDLRIARITALDGLRQILAKRLSPEVVDLNRRLQKVEVDIAAALLPVFKSIERASVVGQSLGTEGENAHAYIQLMTPPISQQLDTGNLQLQLFDLQITEASKINDLAGRHLQKELAAANARKSRLNIVAPSPGKLRLKVTAGQFIRHGESLFAIS